AAGLYPARTVRTLDAIIRDSEASPFEDVSRRSSDALHNDHAQALCEAAITLANRGDAQAIVAVTRGGTTARRLSALRPRAPIIAATNHEETARRLSIYWGVVPLRMDIGENVDAAGTIISQELLARGLVRAGGT